MLVHNEKKGVKPGVETVIASYDVPSNNIVALRGFEAFGTCAAIYRLYAGTEVRAFCVTSEADRQAIAKVDENVVGPITISLKVIHYTPKNTRTDQSGKGIEYAYHDFEGAILGE